MILTVLTYNIRHGLGLDDTVDIDRIGEVIARSNADIVCLQEVDYGLPRSGFVHQSEYLANVLHFHHFFRANFGIPIAGMGNAILSRYELYFTWNKPLSFTGEPRGLLRAVSMSPVGPIEVFSTHWGLTASQRQKQSQSCSESASERDDPKIFCGDLNAVISSDEVKLLLLRSEFVDCGPQVAKKNTFTSSLPVVKIDYVLASPEFTIRSAEILKSDASDHLPLLVTLEIAE